MEKFGSGLFIPDPNFSSNIGGQFSHWKITSCGDDNRPDFNIENIYLNLKK